MTNSAFLVRFENRIYCIIRFQRDEVRAMGAQS